MIGSKYNTFALFLPAHLDAEVTTDGAWVGLLGVSLTKDHTAHADNIVTFPDLK